MSDLRPLVNDAHRFAPAAPDDSLVYGACCPGWHSAAAHETAIDQWLSFMDDQGIERVCCLLPGRQLDSHGANVSRYRDAFGDDAVEHVPIPDLHLADGETLREDILPFLDDAVAAEEPVVVHSLAGIGRTGQVLAAWLVHGRGYHPPEAIDTVRQMGRDPMEPIEEGTATRLELLDVLESLT